MNRSILTGASIGAASGALMGANVSGRNRGRSTTVGALSGALIGGLSSYFIHKGLGQRDARTRKETLFNLDKFNVSAPNGFGQRGSYHGLTVPKIESEWVPTRVNGKKLIEGHKVWLITDEAHWMPGNEIKLRNRKRNK